MSGWFRHEEQEMPTQMWRCRTCAQVKVSQFSSIIKRQSSQSFGWAFRLGAIITFRFVQQVSRACLWCCGRFVEPRLMRFLKWRCHASGWRRQSLTGLCIIRPFLCSSSISSFSSELCGWVASQFFLNLPVYPIEIVSNKRAFSPTLRF